MTTVYTAVTQRYKTLRLVLKIVSSLRTDLFVDLNMNNLHQEQLISWTDFLREEIDRLLQPSYCYMMTRYLLWPIFFLTAVQEGV